MACLTEETVLEFLGSAAGGGDTRAAVEAHIDGCADCRRLVVEVARTSLARPAAASSSPSPSPSSEENSTLPAARGPADVHPDAAALPAGETVGRFVILTVLGRGAMGVVYAAYDPELDRKVALKLIHPRLTGDDTSGEAQARLVKEARAIARLSHPAVVTVHDVGRAGERVFIAMEFVDGQNLAEWLAASPRSWREVLEVFVQAGHGLSAAHRAGLVHRDFKPANVLVGFDGRVRVSDFGLARVAPASMTDDAPAAPAAAAAAGDDRALDTRSDAVIGTPAYMAPEQFAGSAVDHRADQFGFAVALWESLFGRRPFDAAGFAERMEAIAAGRLVEPPADSKVPRRVRKALERALAARPADRWPALGDLVTAVELPSRRRRRTGWLAAATAVLALTAFGWRWLDPARAAVCRGAARKLHDVWSDATKERVHAAFLATGRPYAETAWQGAARGIGRYAAGWAAMHTEACEATSVRRDQSADVLDLRMACLDRRRDELRALVELLAGGDPAVVERAGAAVGALTDLSVCADAAALRAPVPPPTELAVRVQVLDAQRRLAQAMALDEAGKFREGLAIAPSIVAAAHKLGYRPLEAEALLVLGSLQFDAGDAALAEGTLRAALLAAEAAHHEAIAAKAWKGLVVATGVGLGRHAEAIRDAEHARAYYGRIDPSGLGAADLDTQLSVVLREKGDFAEARRVQTEAIATYERRLPPDDRRLARARNNLANVANEEGHYEEALATFQSVVKTLEASEGPAHPEVARALGNIALTLTHLGRYQEAMEVEQKTLAIEEAALGKDHPEIAKTLNGLGNLAADLDHNQEALGYYRRAIELSEKAYGPEHTQVSSILANLAIVERDLGDRAGARRDLERATAIDEKLLGADNIVLASNLVNLALLSQAEHAYPEAQRLIERALAIRLKALGPDHPDVAKTYVSLANVLGDQKKDAEAVALLDKGLAIHEQALGPEHPTVANALYNLGNRHYAMGNYAKAKAALARSVEIFEKRLGPGHQHVAFALTALGGTEHKLGELPQAVAHLERAIAIREKAKALPTDLAESWDELARTLWDVRGDDRARARDLARRAAAAYRADQQVSARMRHLDEWMAARGIARGGEAP